MIDACDPDADMNTLKRLVKSNTGENLKLTRDEICQVYDHIESGKLPLPPLIMDSTRTYLIDKKSPLTAKDYDVLFSSSIKKSALKRLARKIGLKNIDALSKHDLSDKIGDRLRYMNVREPVRVVRKRVGTRTLAKSINKLNAPVNNLNEPVNNLNAPVNNLKSLNASVNNLKSLNAPVNNTKNKMEPTSKISFPKNSLFKVGGKPRFSNNSKPVISLNKPTSKVSFPKTSLFKVGGRPKFLNGIVGKNTGVSNRKNNVVVPNRKNNVVVPNRKNNVVVPNRKNNVVVPEPVPNISKVKAKFKTDLQSLKKLKPLEVNMFLGRVRTSNNLNTIFDDARAMNQKRYEQEVQNAEAKAQRAKTEQERKAAQVEQLRLEKEQEAARIKAQKNAARLENEERRAKIARKERAIGNAKSAFSRDLLTLKKLSKSERASYLSRIRTIDNINTVFDQARAVNQQRYDRELQNVEAKSQRARTEKERKLAQAEQRRIEKEQQDAERSAEKKAKALQNREFRMKEQARRANIRFQENTARNTAKLEEQKRRINIRSREKAVRNVKDSLKRSLLDLKLTYKERNAFVARVRTVENIDGIFEEARTLSRKRFDEDLANAEKKRQKARNDIERKEAEAEQRRIIKEKENTRIRAQRNAMRMRNLERKIEEEMRKKVPNVVKPEPNNNVPNVVKPEPNKKVPNVVKPEPNVVKPEPNKKVPNVVKPEPNKKVPNTMEKRKKLLNKISKYTNKRFTNLRGRAGNPFRTAEEYNQINAEVNKMIKLVEEENEAEALKMVEKLDKDAKIQGNKNRQALKKLLKSTKTNQKQSNEYMNAFEKGRMTFKELKENITMKAKRNALFRKINKKPVKKENESEAMEASRLFDVSSGLKNLARGKEERKVNKNVLEKTRRLVGYSITGRGREKFLARGRAMQNIRPLVNELDERLNMINKVKNLPNRKDLEKMIRNSNVIINRVRIAVKASQNKQNKKIANISKSLVAGAIEKVKKEEAATKIQAGFRGKKGRNVARKASVNNMVKMFNRQSATSVINRLKKLSVTEKTKYKGQINRANTKTQLRNIQDSAVRMNARKKFEENKKKEEERKRRANIEAERVRKIQVRKAAEKAAASAKRMLTETEKMKAKARENKKFNNRLAEKRRLLREREAKSKSKTGKSK